MIDTATRAQRRGEDRARSGRTIEGALDIVKPVVERHAVHASRSTTTEEAVTVSPKFRGTQGTTVIRSCSRQRAGVLPTLFLSVNRIGRRVTRGLATAATSGGKGATREAPTTIARPDALVGVTRPAW